MFPPYGGKTLWNHSRLFTEIILQFSPVSWTTSLFSLESIPCAYLSFSLFFLVCLKHMLTLSCQVMLTNEGLVWSAQEHSLGAWLGVGPRSLSAEGSWSGWPGKASPLVVNVVVWVLWCFPLLPGPLTPSCVHHRGLGSTLHFLGPHVPSRSLC